MSDLGAYRPDPELALMADQVSFFFHVMIGIDPIGDFQGVDNITTLATPYSHAEGGRNYSPRLLPFHGPKQHGELTLRWGMLIRSKLYEWMNSVEMGFGFRREVYILQLTRQKIPMRLMRLSGAWPVAWQGGSLDSNYSTFAVEQVTLAYEDFALVTNKALLLTGFGGNSKSSETDSSPAPVPSAWKTPPTLSTAPPPAPFAWEAQPATPTAPAEPPAPFAWEAQPATPTVPTEPPVPFAWETQPTATTEPPAPKEEGP